MSYVICHMSYVCACVLIALFMVLRAVPTLRDDPRRKSTASSSNWFSLR